MVSTREGNQGTARARDDLELEASVPPQFWGEGGPSEAGAGFSAVLSGSFWYRRWEDERTPLVEPFLRSSPGQPAQQQPAQHLGTRQTDTAARLGSSNDCARRGRRGQPTITSRWPRPRTPPVGNCTIAAMSQRLFQPTTSAMEGCCRDATRRVSGRTGRRQPPRRGPISVVPEPAVGGAWPP